MENIILCAIPLILFFVLVSIQLISTKPNGRIIKKYGKPIKYFSNKKCFNTVPLRGTSVGMYIYSDFIILLDGGKEYFLDKAFKNFKLYGTILIKIFEIDIENGKTLQININQKQENILKEFFKIENENL